MLQPPQRNHQKNSRHHSRKNDHIKPLTLYTQNNYNKYNFVCCDGGICCGICVLLDTYDFITINRGG